MQVNVTKESESVPDIYVCGLGHFYGELQGDAVDTESFVAELDCDDVFCVGQNLTILSKPNSALIEACDGKTRVVGQVVEIYENQTALLWLKEASWIIEYEGAVGEGQWVELYLKSFDIYPVGL